MTIFHFIHEVADIQPDPVIVKAQNIVLDLILKDNIDFPRKLITTKVMITPIGRMLELVRINNKWIRVKFLVF